MKITNLFAVALLLLACLAPAFAQNTDSQSAQAATSMTVVDAASLAAPSSNSAQVTLSSIAADSSISVNAEASIAAPSSISAQVTLSSIAADSSISVNAEASIAAPSSISAQVSQSSLAAPSSLADAGAASSAGFISSQSIDIAASSLAAPSSAAAVVSVNNAASAASIANGASATLAASVGAASAAGASSAAGAAAGSLSRAAAVSSTGAAPVTSSGAAPVTSSGAAPVTSSAATSGAAPVSSSGAAPVSSSGAPVVSPANSTQLDQIQPLPTILTNPADAKNIPAGQKGLFIATDGQRQYYPGGSLGPNEKGLIVAASSGEIDTCAGQPCDSSVDDCCVNCQWSNTTTCGTKGPCSVDSCVFDGTGKANCQTTFASAVSLVKSGTASKSSTGYKASGVVCTDNQKKNDLKTVSLPIRPAQIAKTKAGKIKSYPKQFCDAKGDCNCRVTGDGNTPATPVVRCV